MREPGSLMKLLSLITLASFVTSCGSMIPERFATIQEVFPPGELVSEEAKVPQEIQTVRSFEAPYEDVFRAASVSASQAQFQVLASDKKKGVLLATRITTGQNPVGVSRKADVPPRYTFYYAILVKEKGPKATTINVLPKRQISCMTWGPGWYLDALILSVVIIGLYLFYDFPTSNSKCEEYASVQWATAPHDSVEQIGQFLTFVQNNLIAAGAL